MITEKSPAVNSSMKAERLKNVLGVNVAGYIKSESGLGEGVRTTLRALEAAEVPFVINNCNFDFEHRKTDKSFSDFSEDNPYPINLVQVNADSLFKFLESAGTDYLKNQYNIGFWAWEMLRFPREWFFAFDLFNEIWTPSNFCIEAISSVSPVPVIRMPHAINLPVPSINRARIGLPEDTFIFLFIFDFSSTVERKNPAAVIKAFIQAFGGEDKKVLLVIKSSNADFEPHKAAALRSLADGAANIKFIDQKMPREELNALIYHTDCYVSLHRAEGFGLTMAEAMFYGKPVIATDYSSNTDFMNVGNSLPVKYEITQLNEDLGFFKRGDLWAEPDVADAAQKMRFVFENQTQAKIIGETAAREMRSRYSPQAVGEKMKDRLLRIADLTNNFAAGSTEETLQEKLKNQRIKLEFAEAEAHQLREKVRLMEASRFWKIRTQWFKLKRGLGLTNKY